MTSQIVDLVVLVPDGPSVKEHSERSTYEDLIA